MKKIFYKLFIVIFIVGGVVLFYNKMPEQRIINIVFVSKKKKPWKIKTVEVIVCKDQKFTFKTKFFFLEKDIGKEIIKTINHKFKKGKYQLTIKTELYFENIDNTLKKEIHKTVDISDEIYYTVPIDL